MKIMAEFSKKTKKIVKAVSIGALLLAAAVGIAVKEAKNNPGANSDAGASFSNSDSGNQEADKPKMVCDDLLNEDGNDLVLKEYGKTEAVDCFSVGCGGLF